MTIFRRNIDVIVVGDNIRSSDVNNNGTSDYFNE